MLFQQVIALLFLPLCLAKSVDVTFRNVTFRGYSIYTEKFKKTIPTSNRLKDFLPESAFDMIEIKDQDIPVLYEDSLADLEDLDELVIEVCGVYEIRPGALRNNPMLRRLSLKGNKLEEIKSNTFNTLPLSTLDLSRNQITTIAPEAFNDMPSLLNINLADNRISAWDASWFKTTPLLTRISMQNNSIEVIPSHAFSNLRGEKRFGKLDLTINLILSHNKIREIHPEAFRGLEKINNLWLDHNSIGSFGEDLLEGVDVKELKLDSNAIECFVGDFSKIFKAEFSNIDVNPLDCDCLADIKKWKEKNSKNIDLFYADMDCTVKRIRKKMTAVEERLKELRSQDKEEGSDIEVPLNKPIK